MLLIVDIDGTLFDNTHRRHLVPQTNQDDPHSWTEFNDACKDDKPNMSVINEVLTLYHCNDNAVLTFLTARGRYSSLPTHDQLQKYFSNYTLYMRDMDDGRHAVEYKKDKVLEIINDNKSTYMDHGGLFWDDQEEIINMVKCHFPSLDTHLVHSTCSAYLTETPTKDLVNRFNNYNNGLTFDGKNPVTLDHFIHMEKQLPPAIDLNLMNDQDFINLMQPKPNKYQREIKPGVLVDVYDVLKAFNIICPAMAHAIKKCLATGVRGHKDVVTDKKEAVASINRSIEMDGDSCE